MDTKGASSMSASCGNLTRQVKVVNDLGLHARSAAMIAKAVQAAESAVWVVKDGQAADAASIIDLLTLVPSSSPPAIIMALLIIWWLRETVVTLGMREVFPLPSMA